MRFTSGVLAIAAGAALWGTDTVLRRPLTGVFHPIQIVFYEHVILAVVVLPVLLRRRQHLAKLNRSILWALIGIAWIGSALATVLFTAAIRIGNPTTAILLQKTQPVFAIALSSLVLREKWRPSFTAIAGVAIVGGYLVAFGLSVPSNAIAFWPAILALGAAISWACSTIWGRIATAQLPVELVTALRFLFALPALFIGALVENNWRAPSMGEFASLVWMALVPGFAALLLYYRGLQQTPASQATIAELAFPVTASLLNWFFLGVTATAIQIAGFALVWAAIFQLSRASKTLVHGI